MRARDIHLVRTLFSMSPYSTERTSCGGVPHPSHKIIIQPVTAPSPPPPKKKQLFLMSAPRMLRGTLQPAWGRPVRAGGLVFGCLKNLHVYSTVPIY